MLVDILSGTFEVIILKHFSDVVFPAMETYNPVYCSHNIFCVKRVNLRMEELRKSAKKTLVTGGLGWM